MSTHSSKVEVTTVPLCFQRPVLNHRDGELFILWGHHLIKQALRAGRTTARALVYEGLSLAEERILAQRYAASRS